MQKLSRGESVYERKPLCQRIIYAFSGLCLISAVLFFASNWFPNITKWAMQVPCILSILRLFMAFGKLWELKAVAAVISMVGVTGVAFAWLVSAADREVLGVPIGVLIKWAYPGTYIFYLCCFLPQVFISVYASNAGMQVASPVAALGVLISAAYLLWVCYMILLNAGEREKIVYAYYKATLKECFSKEEDSLQNASSIVQKTAQCAHEQLVREHRLHGKDTLGIWLDAAKHIFGPPDTSPSGCEERGLELHRFFMDGDEHAEITAVFMMEDCWYTLLQGTGSASKRKLAIQEILLNIDQEGSKQPEELMVIAGLIFAIYDLYRDKNYPLFDAWHEFQNLFSPANIQANQHSLSKALRQNLILGFAMSLVVQTLWEERSPQMDTILQDISTVCEPNQCLMRQELELIQETVGSVSPEELLTKSLQRACENNEEGNLELLLWYVEWGTNLKRPEFNGFAYLERLEKAFLFTDKNVPSHSIYEIGNMYYRELLIFTLLNG